MGVREIEAKLRIQQRRKKEVFKNGTEKMRLQGEEHRRAMVRVLRDSEGLSSNDLQRALANEPDQPWLSIQQLLRHIRLLMEEGTVVREGSKRTARYRLAP